MLRRTAVVVLSIVAAAACSNVPALAQLPPPPPPPATLGSFLGIPQTYRRIRDGMANKNGNRPNMERKPPLKAIADPENLKSENPAIKKAAEVKKEEDLKEQKIKAVKYLASIGCGCYNRDGSITDALLKAMDDCTEGVRLETIRAISVAANGEMCANCKQKSCCSEEMSNKLYEIAYGRDETGCYLEPSERVRLSAAEAMRVCCPGTDDGFLIEQVPMGETPRGELPGEAPPSGGERPGAPGTFPLQPVPPTAPSPGVPTPAIPQPGPAARSEEGPAGLSSSRRNMAEAIAASTAPRQRVMAGGVLGFGSFQLPTGAGLEFAAPTSADLPVSQSQAIAASGAPAGAFQEEEHLAPITSAAEMRKAAVRLPPPPEPEAQGADLFAAPPLPRVSQATPAAPQAAVVRESATVTQASAEATATPSGATSSRRNRNAGGNAAPADLPKDAGLPAQAAPMPAKTEAPMHAPVPATTAALRAPQPLLPAGHPQLRQVRRQLPGAKYGTGIVTSVRMREGLAHLEFDANSPLPRGSIIRAYHEFALTSEQPVCDLEVILSEPGMAIAKPKSGSRLGDLSVGDHAIVLQ